MIHTIQNQQVAVSVMLLVDFPFRCSQGIPLPTFIYLNQLCDLCGKIRLSRWSRPRRWSISNWLVP